MISFACTSNLKDNLKLKKKKKKPPYLVLIKEDSQNKETVQTAEQLMAQVQKKCGVPSHHLGNTMRAAGSLCRSYALH